MILPVLPVPWVGSKRSGTGGSSCKLVGVPMKAHVPDQCRSHRFAAIPPPKGTKRHQKLGLPMSDIAFGILGSLKPFQGPPILCAFHQPAWSPTLSIDPHFENTVPH